jgi:Flp pilus assembly protein TadG
MMKKKQEHQYGATILFVSILILALLGFAALAIDIGYLMAARNEAQNVADAAALAGCGELGEQHYQKIEPIDEGRIRSVARAVAGNNEVAGESMSIAANSDIEVGYWDPETKTFSPTSIGILHKKNGVRVTVKRNDSENGPINTFFANVLGIDSFSVSAKATAALTGAKKVPEGALMPVGISKYWFHHVWPSRFCDQPIKFYPTNSIDGCAGWNTFTHSPSSASYLRDTIFDGMLNGSFESPETELGDSFDFIGGNIANALCHPTKSDFEDLYNANKNSTGSWKTSVVVYDLSDCSNPNTTLSILGFATAIIHGVSCRSPQQINATVICDEYVDSRGGGGMYGTFGKIPGLVE